MSKLTNAYNLSQKLVENYGLLATIKRYSQSVDDFGEPTQSTLSTVYTDVPVVIKEKRLPPVDLSNNMVEFKTYYNAIFNLATTAGEEISLQVNDIVEIDSNTYILLNYVKEPIGFRALLAREQ